ncbi:hypothetical protein FRACYDRAFT_249993 [Fragilariopsis cylindrus CCMP1102]|uniref:G-protein coupled receptors family 2 profile 2 domain-containing protein n=1 Tax=Fragilariopsis cylindrus CCMP1102 TaxID=635003 RepID=A0A1E7EQN8_9STRA|nr:hypothetical protein FRACYDRAFT_249993 [Fragilariopsis cylindrus CCMP1102]|eukprot:OEU08205.1 hypothetical protein FRACYDRAFT_249993 [Fragilariopsis cylindrus CCMP1102]
MSDFYYEESSSLTQRFLNTSSSSIEDEQQDYTTEQQQHDQQQQHYTEHEQIILSWTARIAGIISFISGLYILCLAYKRRDHVYHRLMLGLSIHILLWSPWHVIGPLAVPRGTPETWGAYGTTQTCTAQGFFFQLAMCIPLYYVFLSCYSWVVIVYGNFNPKKYQWIEKYIHIIVHIYPIASSIYLLCIEAFNSTGLGQCWISSIPFGCGDYDHHSDYDDHDDDSPIVVVCERGPQDITKKLVYFAGIPAIFYLLFPTIMMGSLCIVVWNKHKQLKKQTQKQKTKQKQKPQLQLKQSLVYVGVLYWIFIPHIIVSFMSVIGNRKHFGMNLFSCIVTDCLGLWIAIMYWYFSTDTDIASSIVISFKNMKHKCTPHQHHFNNNSNKTTTVTTVNSCAHCGDEENNNQEHGNEDEEISKPFSIKSSNSRDNSGKNKYQQHNTRMKPRFSFNIFDGTAPANGRLSEFVFDGDDEDEINDEKESEYWSGCQNG